MKGGNFFDEFYTEQYLEDVNNEGIWTEEFHRVKTMASRILLKKGFVRNLPTLAKFAIPAVSFDTKNYIVTDEIVDELYGESVMQSLKDAGLDVVKLVIPSLGLDETGDASTEKSKSVTIFHDLIDEILGLGITKNSCIISLGGGVVNNICGFIAGTLYRGIHLVHITTTMMGMVDAAIDFKQAINHCRGKNLLGCYYPAEVILIDPELLVSQSERAIRNGMAESLKHGICHSPKLVDVIVNGAAKIKDVDYLTEIVKMTITLKAPTLTHYDESDFNEMCPQYGHAVGHSAEFMSFNHGDKALLHGEGVAIGSCVSAEISLLLGYCDKQCVEEHYRIHRQAGLPVFVPEALSIDMVCKQMLYDKHYHTKSVTMGLVDAIGEMHQNADGTFTNFIEPTVLRAALQANYDRRDSVQNSLTKKEIPLAAGFQKFSLVGDVDVQDTMKLVAGSF